MVGVATLLRLATIGFNIEYKEFFQEFLDQVRNIVELGFLVDPIDKLVHGFLEWVRSFGWHIPDLQPHWQQVFTLSWLLMAAIARNWSGALEARMVLAFACALASGVAAGTAPPDSVAIFFYPAAGFVLFFGLAGLPDFVVNRHRAVLGLMTLFQFIVMAIAAYVSSDTKSVAGAVQNPALLLLVLSVGFSGIVSIIAGQIGRLIWREKRDSEIAATGFDIVAVMGLALAIGYVMMK